MRRPDYEHYLLNPSTLLLLKSKTEGLGNRIIITGQQRTLA
jgi:hypothetical protein